MSRRRQLSSIKACLIALTLGLFSGCALWKAETWDLERYRDERARDIDERLSQDVPIGPNPFGTPVQ